METQVIPIETKKELPAKQLGKNLPSTGKTPDPKAIDMNTLTAAQRRHLKDGLKDVMMSSKQWSALGAEIKTLFYSVCEMIAREESLEMLNISGQEYWKSVDVPNSRKKESVRFMKFKFDFYIPGPNNCLSAVKEWRYEDFR